MENDGTYWLLPARQQRNKEMRTWFSSAGCVPTVLFMDGVNGLPIRVTFCNCLLNIRIGFLPIQSICCGELLCDIAVVYPEATVWT